MKCREVVSPYDSCNMRVLAPLGQKLNARNLSSILSLWVKLKMVFNFKS